MNWRIYYKDAVISGASQAEWFEAAAEGVQVVALMRPPTSPYPDRVKTGFVFSGRSDRTFYTGVDQYDPLGYGYVKTGLLLPDEDYARVWERAYGDD